MLGSGKGFSVFPRHFIFFLAVFVYSMEGLFADITGEESFLTWVGTCFRSLREYNYSLSYPKVRFDELLRYTVGRAELEDIPPSVLTVEVFGTVLKRFLDLYEVLLNNPPSWVDGSAVNILKDEFHTYAQGFLNTDDDEVYEFGDIHGSLHSLLRSLLRLYWAGVLQDDFNIKGNVKFVFTGDYADRGRYGVEVWYTLMRLKLANPDKVFLIRGNHETMTMSSGGLMWELFAKFYTPGALLRPVRRIIEGIKLAFQVLPVAVMIAVFTGERVAKFIQFCHGGLGCYLDAVEGVVREIDLNPLLALVVGRRAFAPCNFYLAGHPVDNGLMWNDFELQPPGRAIMGDDVAFGRSGTNLVLAASALMKYFIFHSGTVGDVRYTISAIIRGHKHLHGGINRLEATGNAGGDASWRPLSGGALVLDIPVQPACCPVYTFTSAPEGVEVHEDAYGRVFFDMATNQWMLEPRVFGVSDSHDTEKYCWMVGHNERGEFEALDVFRCTT